ncbi:hypothetical protein ACA910_010379 [Epithemia clementina (nom. ined.)]
MSALCGRKEPYQRIFLVLRSLLGAINAVHNTNLDPTQGQKNHHSLISPNKYNGHSAEEEAPPLPNYKFDDEYTFSDVNFSSFFMDDNKDNESDEDISSDEGSQFEMDGEDRTKKLSGSNTCASVSNNDVIKKRKWEVPPLQESDKLESIVSPYKMHIADLEKEVIKLQKAVAKADILSYYVRREDATSDAVSFSSSANSSSLVDGSHSTTSGVRKQSSDCIVASSLVDGSHSTTSGVWKQSSDCIVAAKCLATAVGSVVTTNRSNKVLNKLASDIVDVIWDKDLLGGRVESCLLNKARCWFSQNDFSPQNILWAMDIRGGVLNYEGVDLLRQCETKGRKRVRNTVMPSTAALQRAAAIVQRYGELHFPFQHRNIQGMGENICFNPFDVIGANKPCFSERLFRSLWKSW